MIYIYSYTAMPHRAIPVKIFKEIKVSMNQKTFESLSNSAATLNQRPDVGTQRCFNVVFLLEYIYI